MTTEGGRWREGREVVERAAVLSSSPHNPSAAAIPVPDSLLLPQESTLCPPSLTSVPTPKQGRRRVAGVDRVDRVVCV